MKVDRVVSTLNEAEAGHTRLCLEYEPATVQQLALQHCEQAFAISASRSLATRRPTALSLSRLLIRPFRSAASVAGEGHGHTLRPPGPPEP